MTWPNFMIIGAAKCGTDALYAYLRQHPQIYMSPTKETNFFIVEGKELTYSGPRDREILEECWVNSLIAYQAQFAQVRHELAIGEASPWYIYDETAPGRIQERLPDMRLIAILRNPADRAFSAYTSLIRDDRETLLDFGKALGAEEQRIASNWEPLWHLTRQGFYARQLRRYFDRFDRAQIKVVIYDDFVAHPNAVIKDLLGFLQVDASFSPDMSERPNVSMVPKNRLYHAVVGRPNILKEVLKPLLPYELRQRIKRPLLARNLTRLAVTREQRARLIDVFKPDILELQEMLGRDLSAWLTVTK
jgi:hypothetical protein